MITRTLLTVLFSTFAGLALNLLFNLVLAIPGAWLWDQGPAVAFHLPEIGYWPAVATLTLAKVLRLAAKGGKVSINGNSEKR